jgi:tRNA pseudouridine38-40 synthase
MHVTVRLVPLKSAHHPEYRKVYALPVTKSKRADRLLAKISQLKQKKMARYKLIIEYDGTRYHGWQAQKGHRTVQGEFFNVFDQLFRSPYEFYGAGRTDSGVHALGQCAHLEFEGGVPSAKLLLKINDLLPADIHVLKIEKVHSGFHSRHDAVARSYVYVMSKRRTSFNKSFCWWIRDNLDIQAMNAVAEEMTGMHDFRSFTSQTPEEGSTLVEIKSIDLYDSEEKITIHIIGSHFLWKMVRRMVGIMAEAGRGGLTPEECRKMLEGFSSLPASLTAPPSGLFLHWVYYPGDIIKRGRDMIPHLLNLR